MTVHLPERQPLKVAPLDLTTSVRDISVTERNEFKSCRRKWHLGTIQNLQPRGVRLWYLDFGTGLHMGLEAYYKTLGGLLDGDPQVNAEDALDTWYEEMDEAISTAGLGPSTSEFRNELLEYKELGEGMLHNYVLYASVEDNFTVCAVEGVWTEEGKKLLEGNMNPPYESDVHPIISDAGRYMVPIVDHETKEWVEGRPYMSAKLDLIIYVRKSGLKGFWVKDHKSSGGAPSERGIDMDDQVTGYDYTFWRHTGIVPRGTTFNYLIKQLPKEPRLVGEGTKLSSAKDQLTTADLYRQAMIDFGHMTESGVITSEKHGECYKALLAHGWGRFFKRMSVQRNMHELMMFERRLVTEHQHMHEAYLDPDALAYPHLSQYNCPGCPVMSICQAIEDGSDYEFVIENGFQQAPDRKAK